MFSVIKHPLVTGLRRMFILVSPNETSFEKLEDVPNYVDEAVPYFIALIIMEWSVLYLRGGNLPRLNDSLSSLSHGLLSLLHSLLFRSTELAAFMWAYTHFNIITLPWNNPITWFTCLLAVDFAYYWVHRFGHEVNFMWAGHQTHHNSEDFNLSTALRQSFAHRYSNWVFYVPLALFLPPSIFLVHNQFNLIYQFWVHTETIGKLGPLEWILSTPSHHRVHHGRNPYCIDKNYGGVFIIWDRLFGTFEGEKDEEKVVYGLVHNINSWEPVYAQLHHFIYVIKTAWNIDGLSNKLSVIFKGPGWSPGKPRLGCVEDIPQVEPSPVKYDSNISVWKAIYIWTHFLILLLFWQPGLSMHKQILSTSYLSMNIAYIVFTLFVFGCMYDKRSYSDELEMIRSVIFVVAWQLGATMPVSGTICGLYLASAVCWVAVVALNKTAVKNKEK
ncbi:alkylglycerol monooxygenase-like isoform X2 [Mercenaria mercenaria]|uniref:alkylglycerol monooxygenase-like isoform X2 n=1 Tax=Mercenaria mercenaria TaxID=6596 RepID=UPI00234F354F|nr:alkylglycerol monooxygenase-like isoform X2 [Mercenaria mercenaria]